MTVLRMLQYICGGVFITLGLLYVVVAQMTVDKKERFPLTLVGASLVVAGVYIASK